MMLTGDGISGWRSVFEGLLRIVIFVLYIVVISKMPEIDRTFRYHGAEHKTIFAMKTTCRSPWKMCGSKSASTRAAAPAL